ncbi:MAG TPA: adenylyltransferase/cytidyltransferase family protein [Candidatus Saccharibacteria bacterium]|nr:adenylyltransferase/cytidyltransferase family protein [Candidatus Saccharibacteria bacterium]
MSKSFYNNGKKIRPKSYEDGILSSQPNPDARFISKHDSLIDYIKAFRMLNLSIVLTSGTFDLLHVGHAKYLEEAKKYGDILIVGVDSDEKVKVRKGPERPVVPANERVKMLAHLRSVDLITLKYPDEPKWNLIKQIKPDTLIVTEETYDDDSLRELSNYCGQVICMEPQATTSTSAKIRKLQVGWSTKITKPVEDILKKHKVSKELTKEILDVLRSGRTK